MRARFFRAGVFGGFVALVAGGASCTSLPDIQAGTCGNGVVEPDHNEDCDNNVKDDAGKTVCYPAGSAAPCHFDCSSHTCPTGFSCGLDAVCRKPKGTFAELGHSTQVAADRLFAGDFDQDGRGDVVAETEVQMEVLYGDQTANLTTPFVIRAESAPNVVSQVVGLNPAIGQLALDPGASDSEPSTDIVFTKSFGVTTWRGRSDRSLLPTGYPSFHIGADQPQFMALRVTNPTDEVLMMLPAQSIPNVTYDGSLIVEIVGGSQLGQAIFAAIPGTQPSALAGAPLVAPLDVTPNSPCDEYVLGFQGSSSIDVYRTCKSPNEANLIDPKELNNPTPTGYTVPLPILFPPGYHVRAATDDPKLPAPIGVHAGDIDGDGIQDLFVDAYGPIVGGGGASGLVTLVAFGVGDGTFRSQPGAAVDNLMGYLTGGNLLLAAGQFTSDVDKGGDLVFRDSLFLSVPSADAAVDSGVLEPSTVIADIPWTEATFADVDFDGKMDIVAGAPGRVDVYKGTGGQLFTHIPYVVNGEVGGIQVGDFDGDRAPDIAFHATQADGSSDLDVMWGKLFGVPDNPVSAGRFPTVRAMVHGVVPSVVGDADAIADLGVLTETDPTAGSTAPVSFDVSVLAGSPTRQLQSIYFLQDNVGQTSGILSFPMSYVVGQFTKGDTHPDLGMSAIVQGEPTPCENDHGNRDGANPSELRLKLAIVQGTGAAQLVNSDTSPAFTECIDGFTAFAPGTDPNTNKPYVVSFADWTRLSMAAVDFDGPGGDGVDEIVGIAPAVTVAGSFFWAKLEADGWKIKDPTPRGAPAAFDQNRESIAQVLAADVNGDGAKDVLLLSDTGASTSLTAYINGQDGKFPTKSAPISLPAYASGATETPFHIVSIAAIDADSDPGKEIALLTDFGATNTQHVGGLFIAKSNAAGDSFTVTGPICSDGSDLNGCANNSRTQIPSGNALATIDVDGDGIQDLVVESGQTLHVYKGLAVDP